VTTIYSETGVKIAIMLLDTMVIVCVTWAVIRWMDGR
jgi:hypothetical protein